MERLDLFIVVVDNAMESVTGRRHDFARSLGEPLLFIHAPQDAPPGGSYLLIVYPGTCGPLILDCMWQPQSMALRPADTLLLFYKGNIPIEEPTSPPPAQTRLERAAAQTNYFWMMTTVMAKYIARRDTWEVLRLLSSLSDTVAKIEWLVGKRSSPPGHRHQPHFPPPIDASGQLEALRYLIAKVSDLAVSESSIRETFPEETLDQINRLCNLVEELI